MKGYNNGLSIYEKKIGCPKYRLSWFKYTHRLSINSEFVRLKGNTIGPRGKSSQAIKKAVNTHKLPNSSKSFVQTSYMKWTQEQVSYLAAFKLIYRSTTERLFYYDQNRNETEATVSCNYKKWSQEMIISNFEKNISYKNMK